MSSPVSSRLWGESLERGVFGGVVGGVVLPAAPDDVGPAAGEDAGGVGVGFARGAQLSVAGFGPGVGAPAVAGEVAERVAKFFVGGPSEGDHAVSAAGAGGRRGAGEGHEGFGCGEPVAAVAHFGEQVPMKRPAQPRELASVYVLLASDEASYISGTMVGVTGGKPIL